LPSLEQLWTNLLAIILILAIIAVSMAGIIFIFAVIVGYRKQAQENRQAQARSQHPDPTFGPHDRVLQGPIAGDPHTSPNDFCPICHYHWTTCANIHVMHDEKVPASITKGVVRINPS
jgi:hypothetical protein